LASVTLRTPDGELARFKVSHAERMSLGQLILVHHEVGRADEFILLHITIEHRMKTLLLRGRRF